MTGKKKNNNARKPKVVNGRRNFLLALAGILIGLFGGVPGYLSIKDYYNKASVRIMFDEKESIPCFIANSPRKAINGNFAILLYGVTIVGKGNQKFVVYDVNVSIRANGFGMKVSVSNLYSEM